MTNSAAVGRADVDSWLVTGTAFVLDRIDRAELAAASRLPGWTNGYVAAHVSRNADAVCRLLRWAATGEASPMYPSSEARAAEIERDAARADEVQRADARATAAAFAAAVEAFPDVAWDRPVRGAGGRTIPASEVPWMRVKEVWLHGVDLGASMSELPIGLVDAVLTDAVVAFDAKDHGPGLTLSTIDTRREIPVRGGGLSVAGPAAEILGWLIGRSSGAGLQAAAPLPDLPRWL